MSKGEIMNKDFEELVKYGVINCMSMLQTVLENQVTMISKLENLPRKDVVAQMNLYLSQNHKKRIEQTKKNIRDKNLDNLFLIQVQ